MKTEEDEAFDELARKQGNWGGGYQAKRQMAADKFIAAEERKVGERYGYVPKLHPSEWMNDHNEDNLDMVAQPAQEPVAQWLEDAFREGWEAYRESEFASKITEDWAFGNSFANCRMIDLQQNTPPQPAQEPVAWVCEGFASDEKHAIDYWQEDVDDIPIGTLLYTTPPKREWVGLTPEDILVLFDEHNLYGSKLVEFTRAVETKIKEKNND